jgi:tRNA threonylcarbamoyladenosine biosynthesis protein TsaE
MFSFEKRTVSSKETYNFGKQLGEVLNFPLIVFLNGEMGMGKTVFAKGFAKGSDIEEEVTSPTYTIVNEYGDEKKIFHFDLYRLGNASELYEMGFEDYLTQGATLLVEWPELITDFSLEPKLEIKITAELSKPNERFFLLKTNNLEIIKGLKRI